jgi:uncharacterized protein YqgC (DUF456 family)
MDMLLLLLGGVFVFIGFLGCILPILPGLPIAWLGLLLTHFTHFAQFSTKFLVITAVITLIVSVLDYFLPAWFTQKFGGTKAGKWGAMIGTFAGIFLGPMGIFLGPLVGALLGEMIVDPNNVTKAIRVAMGTFVAFLLGTGLKLIWCVCIIWWYFSAIL